MTLFTDQDIVQFKKTKKFRQIYQDYKIPNNYPKYDDILASYLLLLGLSFEEIQSHPNSYTLTIAHEIANLFKSIKNFPIFCITEHLLDEMVLSRNKVQKNITAPVCQKVSFGLLLFPKSLSNNLDDNVQFLAFAQYCPVRKLPIDIYSDPTIVRNPPPYFRESWRIVFSSISSNCCFYSGIRYVDIRGSVIDGELKDKAQNNYESQFVNQLWGIVAQSLINFENHWGFLQPCPRKKKFFLF